MEHGYTRRNRWNRTNSSLLLLLSDAILQGKNVSSEKGHPSNKEFGGQAKGRNFRLKPGGDTGKTRRFVPPPSSPSPRSLRSYWIYTTCVTKTRRRRRVRRIRGERKGRGEGGWGYFLRKIQWTSREECRWDFFVPRNFNLVARNREELKYRGLSWKRGRLSSIEF